MILGNAILKTEKGVYPVLITQYDIEINNAMTFEGQILGEVAGMDLVSPIIKKVIFNDPATVVIWGDGSKTVVKCQSGDSYSKETGLALCIAKKFLGNKGNFNEVFKKWIPEEISVEEMRKTLTDYCSTKDCYYCTLKSPRCRCRCGRGTYFYMRKGDGTYDMSDDEIRAAYNCVFN